ncbi:MAG TPA: hypothetical protein VGD06_09525 [Acidobacteriota bacterium]
MSAKKQRKGAHKGQAEESSPQGPPESLRAVTYVRMQLADLEFLAMRKLMTDPRTFEQVKGVLAEATTKVLGIQTMELSGCTSSDECELDEHCKRGECVFGPPRK